MSFLDNEVFLRVAISNIASMRGTTVKFKGFILDSYSRSLCSQFKRLVGRGFHLRLHKDYATLNFSPIRMFSDNPIDEKTKRINEILYAPFIHGDFRGRRVHTYYAYNASEAYPALYRLRNYMASKEYLKGAAEEFDNALFDLPYYRTTYPELDASSLTDRQIAYYSFIKDFRFDTVLRPFDAGSAVPYLPSGNYSIYSHRENVILMNLSEGVFMPRLTLNSFYIHIPYNAFLDRDFLTLLSAIHPEGFEEEE